MRIETLHVEGLRHSPLVEVRQLPAVAELPPPPAGVSLADGLDLLVAALDVGRAAEVCARLGLGLFGEVLAQGDQTSELAGLEPDGVHALVDPTRVMHVVVQVGLRLDPVQFQRIREGASRNPPVLTQLLEGAGLGLRVGWLFNAAGTHAHPSVLSAAVGTAQVPVELDRPSWLPPLLTGVARRVHRLTPVDPDAFAHELLEAQLSPDRATRDRAELARRTLTQAPFHLPAAHLVRRRGAPELCFGDDLVPARLLGEEARDALRWVHAAVLRAPDVLVADGVTPSPALRAWLDDRIEGPDATLEQVLFTAPRAEAPA